MLNPSVDQLLAGMADALARTVLPELPPGPARDELQAAIALTRRLARAVPQLGPYLHADLADLAEGLTRLWAATGRTEPTDGPVADALALARSLPPGPPPTTTELTTADLALRGALADVATPIAGSAAEGGDDGGLLDLLTRLTHREADQLRLSPWTRL